MLSYTSCAKLICSRNIVSKISFYSLKRCNSTAVVRTRFAPSPTGFLHLGSLRTALFNYLWAKKSNGKFILRLEDTDQKRKVTGSDLEIYKVLKQFNLQWDEGPIVGGPYGPYEQSSRIQIYQKYAQHLIETGRAYVSYSVPIATTKIDSSTKYHEISIDDLTDAQRKLYKSKKFPYVVRFRMKEPSPFTDLVYGKIAIKSDSREIEESNNFVILKSDGFPTYHFANVVDDHLMHITHVIRGEEWVPSTIKHIQLYEAFGWKPPKFAHLPLLVNPDGSKLSKRQNDAHVSSLLQEGFLPEAILNFIALMGWSSRQKSDFLPMKELIDLFSIDKLTKSSSIVAFEKLYFLNKNYLRRAISDVNRLDELIELVQPRLIQKFSHSSRSHDKGYTKKLLLLLKNKVHTIKEFEKIVFYFYEAPDLQQIRSLVSSLITVEELPKILTTILNKFETIEWNTHEIQISLKEIAMEHQMPLKKIQSLLRYGLCGNLPGGGISDTISLLGRETVKSRLERLLLSLKHELPKRSCFV